MNKAPRFLTLGLVGLFALAASSINAAPPWWEGPTEDVPAAAAQTGKPVVLYFHSPNAAECVRMAEETWAPMNPVWADLRFHWLKLEPRKDAEFFKYWEINQVPQVVILDSQMRDQLRLRGFMELDRLKESLERVERTVPSVYTTVGGSTVAPSNPYLDPHTIRRDPHKGHVYFESFDAYRLIGSISNPPFSPVVQASTRVSTNDGVDGTPCLTVDSGRFDKSLIQIDISQKFKEIDQVLGRIRVRAKLKALTSLGKVPVDVMALNVVRLDDVQDPNEQEQFYFISLSDEDRGRWREKEVVSAPLNFRINKAFVMLSAQDSRTSFHVDDITVDLLPPDDIIPYVDTDSQVRSIAALNEDSGSGDAEDPNSFFQKLSSRAKVRQSTSVSNNVSRPVESSEGDDSAGDEPRARARELTKADLKQLAEQLRGTTVPERNQFFDSQGLNKAQRFRVEMMVRQQGKKK